MKLIVGRDYWPNPTLRQMPRHWVLSETEQRFRGPSMAGFIFLIAGCGLFWFVLGFLLANSRG